MAEYRKKYPCNSRMIQTKNRMTVVDNRPHFQQQYKLINDICNYRNCAQCVVAYPQPNLSANPNSRKCYSYSVFNALVQSGNAPTTGPAPGGVAMTAANVDDWITANIPHSIGGGAQQTISKLQDQGRTAFRTVKRTLPIHYLAYTGIAAANNLPILIGVDFRKDGIKKSTHWIFGHGSIGGNIIGEDQQNAGFGVLTFVRNDGMWVSQQIPVGGHDYSYKINYIDIMIRNAADSALIP